MLATYEKELRPRLADRVREMMLAPRREEMLLLYEEIAVARTFAAEQVRIAEALADHYERRQGGDETAQPVTWDTVFAAQGLVRQQLEHVASLCSQMARIQKDVGDRVGVEQLGAFVEGVTRIIRERLGVEQAGLAGLIASDLQHKLELPYRPAGSEFVPLDVEVRIEYG